MTCPAAARPEPVSLRDSFASEGRFAQSSMVRQAQDERGLAWERGLRFAGYAALFGRRDAGGDVILPGAFAASLASAAGPLPLLWEHRPHSRVGVVERIGEDARGLRVVARLNPASRAAALLADGSVRGLSFGYRARAYRMDGRTRVLSAVELFEVSLVTHPLQAGARVHFVSP